MDGAMQQLQPRAEVAAAQPKGGERLQQAGVHQLAVDLPLGRHRRLSGKLQAQQRRLVRGRPVPLELLVARVRG
jgi:hypothetical protein